MLMSMCGAWIGEDGVQQGFQVKKEVQGWSSSSPQGGGPKELSSSPVRSPRPMRTKNDAQVIYEVGFGRSLYGWKQNFITLPMELVWGPNSSRVNKNHQKKWTSRISQGTTPIHFGLLAQQEAHVGLGYYSRVWRVPLGTVVPPLVATWGCAPYLDRPLIYFRTRVCFKS
jgi:hypothetical protein